MKRGTAKHIDPKADEALPLRSPTTSSSPAPSKHSISRSSHQSRPALSAKRSTPSSLSNVSSVTSRSSSSRTSPTDGDSKPRGSHSENMQGTSSGPIPLSPSNANLQELREAVKNVQGKSIERIRAHGGAANQAKKIMGPDTSRSEPTMSPSLDAAFSSPLATGTQSASTESTESVKTVRGTMANTPNELPMRTPSYPFPYVPSVLSSARHYAQHQPFTTLSPTVSANRVPTQSTAHERYSGSAQSTPIAQPNIFSPGSATPQGLDSRSAAQGPSLYDVVLKLNTDPTLAAWWQTLTVVLHEHYNVDRASMALPADATDIENVPWGQKAVFSSNGIRQSDFTQRSWSHSISAESDASRSSSSKKSEAPELLQTVAGRAGLTRPSMESRHSFAGYEYGRHNAESPRLPSPTVRPSPFRRTTTHAAVPRGSTTLGFTGLEFPSPTREMPDQDNISMAGEQEASSEQEITAMVLPMLRALDREEDALLNSAGVNRVLQRGRLVTLTRDYPSESDRRASATETNVLNRGGSTQDEIREGGKSVLRANMQSGSNADTNPRTSLFRKGVVGNAVTDRQAHTEAEPYFEEYEQLPTSPWAQSPAPSPAIQNDPEQNPFFVSGGLDEETFSPSRSPAVEDYSRFQEVEAIGVDRASTIVHIPLIHPQLSRVLSQIHEESTTPGQASANSGDDARERRSPVAILSILSSDVPYSQALVHSLKMLGPHLATSFQTSLQNTILQERVTATLYHQQRNGQGTGFAAMPSIGLGLNLGFESLLRFDPEDSRSSTVDSITSPSDYSAYSGHSKHSPTGSVVATPGLDPSVHFRKPSGNTPGQIPVSEPIDNYFEIKKRSTLSRSRSGGPVSLGQQASQPGARAPSTEPRLALRKVEISPGREVSQGRKESRKARVRDDKTHRDSSPKGKRALPPHEPGDSRRTVLHSYGADFSTSFQSLPVASVPRNAHHGRGASVNEPLDMPPPSERLLRTIIDSLPVQIFTAAPLSGRITWVNSKFLVYCGQTPRQVLENPWEPIHPDDLVDYTANWHRSLHTGQQFQHKVRLRRFDDHYRWYFVRAAPLRDKGQAIVHWVGTMIDLHDQHVAEVNAAKQQETSASEAKYRALANSSPQIVFAATRSRGITFCNSQWLAYSGQTEEQAKTTGFMEFVHPEDLTKCKLPPFEPPGTIPPQAEAIRPRRTKSGVSEANSEATDDSTVTATAITATSPGLHVSQRRLSELDPGPLRMTKDATGKPSYATEVRLRMASGEYRWHLVRVLLAEPLISAVADEETWYGTCTDINDHKELEQTLKETMDAKSRFLSNMSHEIRTPLNGIAGMANFLIDSNLTAEQLDHVNVIRASTEGLRDLINDILDLSKVEAGMITLNMDWFRIRSVIEEVNDLMSSLALEKGLELNYLVDDDVPSMVKGDKFRFRQVLLNVIGNAIKFTPEGEVFTQCKLLQPLESLESADSVMLQIEIADTGQGFTEKEAERLFKRFSQIDGSSTRQHGGTGLGLAISMQLVELHGGSMSAKSMPGKGSTFTFSLKFALPTKDDRPVGAAISPGFDSIGPSMIVKPGDPQPNPSPVANFGPDPAGRPLQPEVAKSPTFFAGLEQRGHTSSSVESPAESDLSVPTTSGASGRSSRSSESSYSSEAGIPIRLGPLPENSLAKEAESDISRQFAKPTPGQQARIYSILVVCTLKWTLQATIGHLNSVLDHHVPHLVTAKQDTSEVYALLSQAEPVLFSHVIISLPDGPLLNDMLRFLLRKTPPSTSLVVLANMGRKKDIMANHPSLDFDGMAKTRRLMFIQKPIKPSRLGLIFDPEKARELSTDLNQQSAAQIALSQKKVFDEMSARIGSKNFKVLLVEDNRINQMVMLKLLRRVSVEVETCLDGVQATDKVLSHPPDYYSIILLDLMMPNKDGYQTCIDIRAWERSINTQRPIPIVALSANVLDDVWHKCRACGFNSYLTKPVEFKELSDVMIKFLDPDDPNAPVPYMGKTMGTSTIEPPLRPSPPERSLALGRSRSSVS